MRIEILVQLRWHKRAVASHDKRFRRGAVLLVRHADARSVANAFVAQQYFLELGRRDELIVNSEAIEEALDYVHTIVVLADKAIII